MNCQYAILSKTDTYSLALINKISVPIGKIRDIGQTKCKCGDCVGRPVNFNCTSTWRRSERPQNGTSKTEQ